MKRPQVALYALYASRVQKTSLSFDSRIEIEIHATSRVLDSLGKCLEKEGLQDAADDVRLRGVARIRPTDQAALANALAALILLL